MWRPHSHGPCGREDHVAVERGRTNVGAGVCPERERELLCPPVVITRGIFKMTDQLPKFLWALDG